MAHELDIRNGKANMMYVNNAPWHGLGQYMGDSAVDWEKAWTGSGLDWEVEMLNLYARPEVNSIDGIAPPLIPASDFRAINRKDVNEVLGVVRTKYQVLQNKDLFQILEPFLDDCKAVWHTAGAIKNGRWVWVLAKLPDNLVIGKQDLIDQYLLITNSHDGSQALRMRFTPIRVVCNNTLQQALLPTEGLVKISHIGNVTQRAGKALETLGLVRQYTNRFSEKAELMLQRNMKEDDIEVFLKQVLGMKNKGLTLSEFETVGSGSMEIEAEKETHGKVKTLNKIKELVEVGAGTDIPGVKGSLWGVYNAVTEFVDHKQTRSHKLQDIWLNGYGQQMKEKAWDLAVKSL